MLYWPEVRGLTVIVTVRVVGVVWAGGIKSGLELWLDTAKVSLVGRLIVVAGPSDSIEAAKQPIPYDGKFRQ